MSKDKSLFLTKWKKYYSDIFTTMYPNLSEKELDKFLDKMIEKNLVNKDAELHNNYIHQNLKVDLLGVYDWYYKNKPIAAGFGVFFNNQNKALNPAAVMLNNFLKLRKSYKDQLKVYNETSYEYETFDRLQATEKINANSYYGASGAPTSNFFNLYTATSVTATGQSLISTTETAFEAFMTNNVLFKDLNDCMNFMRNCCHDKRDIDDSFLPDIHITKVVRRMLSMFCDYKQQGYIFEKKYGDIITKYLLGLSQRDLNRLYFKNNLYEFSNINRIKNKIYIIINRVGKFINPNKVPDEIKSEMDDLWNYYKEFVFYNHFAFGRIDRLKKDKRKTVVTVDTDSNMLNLDPWVKYIFKQIIFPNDHLLQRDPDQLRFVAVNMMCYFLTNMVTDVLWKYTKGCHIPKEYRSKINMKNEFLFTRIILASTKKRYITSVRLREGKEIFPEKVDIKGMDFNKSSTREETKKYFTKLVKEKLLQVKEINISEILRDLENFEGVIRDSLMNGEKKFLIPASVKELESYSDPLRIQGVRGVMVWNFVYPEMEISLPDKVDIVKVNLENLDDCEKLRNVDMDIYNKIHKHIFNNPNPKIVEKGVRVIAIPRNVQKIPDWIMSFIDYDTIVNDNLSRFYSVFEGLGLETIKTSKKEYFSNILSI